MKRKFFNENSRINNFAFRKMLAWLESPFRYRFNDPQKLIKASGIHKGQKVLEVGCGSGFFTPLLSYAVGEDGFVESIDLHPAAVEVTISKIQELGIKNVQINKADAHKTNFSDASFDLILVYGVVPAPVISEIRLGQEIHRLLKSGGTLAIWTLAPFWLPKSFLKTDLFTYGSRQQGVHRLKKKAA